MITEPKIQVLVNKKMGIEPVLMWSVYEIISYVNLVQPFMNLCCSQAYIPSIHRTPYLQLENINYSKDKFCNVLLCKTRCSDAN